MVVGMDYSFSIREYAARMRSVDVVKCWPFEEADEETVKTMLPPITIKKFRWWFDELELVHSNCAHYGKRSNKKVQEVGEISDLESENIESMRMKRVDKTKGAKGKLKLKNKPPKKRSIVELFAVSPQVERVNSDNGEDDDDSSYNEEDSDTASVREVLPVGNVGSKCKNKRKVKKKGTASMLGKKRKLLKNLKKRVNNKTKSMGKDTALVTRNARKENASRLKSISSVGSVAIPNCLANDAGIMSGSSSHKKEPTLKCLASKKKRKALKTSKVTGKNKKLMFPMHGILKNRTEVFQVKKCGSSISQDASKISTCKTQCINKHVTFSVPDDGLVAKRSTNSTVELELEQFCSLSSDCTGASKVNEHTAECRGGQTIHQMVEVELENDNCPENETNVQLDSGMQFSNRCHDTDAPNFLTHHASGQEDLCNKSVDLSPVALHDENLKSLEEYSRGKSQDALYSGSTLPVTHDDRIPKLTNPVFGESTDASSSNGSFSGCFTDFLSAYPQPSTSCKSINENCTLHFPSQVTQQYYYDHAFQYPRFPHLSPKELMRTICPLQDWKSRVAISGETGTNGDLVGLPLNSQGELIRMNSNVSGRLDHLRDTSTILDPSICSAMHNDVPTNFMFDQAYFRSWNGVTSQADHFRMCRREDFGSEMENLSMSSRFNPLEQRYGVRRTNVTGKGLDHSFHALESEMDLAKMLSNSSRQDQLVKKHPGNPNHISLQFSQSTMRLMGKEFKIGGNELQKLEDREIWRDREAIKAQHANTATGGPCISCHDLPEFSVHPISTKLKNAVIHLSEAEINPASASVPHTIVPESRISCQFLQSQDNMTYHDGYGIGKGNMMPETCSQFSLAASPLTGSGRTVCQDPFVCGYRSPAASQTLVPASLFHESNQYLSRSRIELTNIQNPPNPSNLAFNLPFLDKECCGHVQQPWSQNSFKVTNPWHLDSRRKGTLNDYNQTYPFPVGSCHDWSISGIDHQIEPSTYPTSEPFYKFPDATFQNSLASSSLLPRPLLQVHSGISPDYVSQNGYREKMKIENCVKSMVGIRIPNPVRSMKRMASPVDDAVKPSKVPKLRMQENSMNTLAALKASPVFEPNVRCIREVPESALGKHKANTVECGKNAAHKLENKVGCVMAFNKLQGAPRSGPIRLTPGAKYILKSSQNKEQTNSKPSPSGNPFAEMATEDRVSACGKSAKIHRF